MSDDANVIINNLIEESVANKKVPEVEVTESQYAIFISDKKSAISAIESVLLKN